MSKEIIQNDIEAIRNETEMYGNTRERVASVLTKLNQEKIDAESIPTNLATIDKNGKAGTTYTKEQADNYFLKKPTSTITQPNTSFKYAILLDEEGNSTKMLAGDLGKNLANSKPNNTPNSGINLVTPWYIDTNGIPLFMRGLPDKSNDTTFNKMVVRDSNGQMAESNGKITIEKLMADLPSVKDQSGNYDLSYSQYAVFNPITGKMAKSDRPLVQSTFNVPATININYPTTIANSNYTPAPTTPQDIRDTFEMIKGLESNYQFVTVSKDLWLLRIMADEKIAPYSDWRVPKDINITTVDGTLNLKGFNAPNELVSNLNFTNSVRDENSFFTLFLNKEFPIDKDWIFRFRVHYSDIKELLFNERGSFFGFSELTTTTQSRKDITDVTTDDYGYIYGLIKNRAIKVEYNSYVYFIKRGSKLSVFVYTPTNGRMYIGTTDFQSYMRYFRIGTDIINPQRLEMGKLLNAYLTDISYWIQP